MNLKALSFQEAGEQTSTLEASSIIGSLKEVIKGAKIVSVRFNPARLKDDGTKTTSNWKLTRADGTFVLVNLSKRLSAAYEAGSIKEHQMGDCSVISGTNEAGEERYYLSAQGVGELDAKDVLSVFDKTKTPKVSGSQLFAVMQELLNA